MSKPYIVVSCPLDTFSGYGSRARDIVRSLVDSEKYDVKVLSQRWGNTPYGFLKKDNPEDKKLLDCIIPAPLTRQPDVWIQITVPNEFQKIGKFSIGITAGIETDVCTPEFIEGCNRMDLVLASSNHTKSVFQKTQYDKKDKDGKLQGTVKLETPVEVLFEGVDVNKYFHVPPGKLAKTDLVTSLDGIKEQFSFLFVGHWLSGNLGEDRKDIGMMLKVFYTMFKNQKNAPALILKTSGAGFSIIDRNEMMKRINAIKDSMSPHKLPNVYLLHGDLTDEEMNQMYNHPKVKAHLTFTHGEGFGRPLLEASLSGKPILAPVSTGQADFLSKDYTVELPHAMTKVPAGAFPKDYHNPEALWSTVNYGIAGRLMKDVFENYSKYKLKAKKQMIVNQQTFSHQAMKDKLESIVDRLLAGIPQQVQLKLPTLKKEPKKLKLPTLKKG
jgi:hypothetical protein